MSVSLNWKQTLCLALGGGATLYVLLLPPWKVGDFPIPYTLQSPFARYVYHMAPFGAGAGPPEPDWARLLLFVAVIGGLTLGMTLALRTRRQDGPSGQPAGV